MLKKTLLLSILVLPLATQAEQLPVVNLNPPGYVDGVAAYCVKHDNSSQAIVCSATDPLNVAIVGGSVSVGTVTSQATAAATPPTYTAGNQNESQTLSGGLRVQPNLGGTDLSLGQTTKAGSIPVTIASDQGALGSVSITGTVPLPTGASTATNQTNPQQTVAAGAAATNSVLGGCVYSTSAPSPTNAQGLANQCDQYGNSLTAQRALAPAASGHNVSNYVVATGARTLKGFGVTVAAISGSVQIFDATTLPGNATPPSPDYKYCFNMAANTSVYFVPPVPMSFTTGIVLGFSSNACGQLTASATAEFNGILYQ